MQVCLACSTTTDENGRFCPSCGAVLARQDASVATAATAHGEGSAAASMIGLVVDGFAIEAVVGGGSFGTVYRGRQLGLDREVAVKIPTAEIAADPVMARRFAREARAASRITHPGVVAIYAVGELPDHRPYLAMQLVEGEPLDRILAGGALPAVHALRIARQIAAALAETHAAGVVHRDLKPSNVIWRRDRLGDDRIVIVDFGIAVAKPGTADAARLTAGGLIGTPHYMSPEQAQGEQVDARADLYALGCLLFELATGEPPFDGSAYEVLLAQLGRPAPPPSSRNAAVPASVDRLVLALMAKKADERPQSADAVVAAIDEALRELEAAAAASTSAAPVARAGRPRMRDLAIGATAALLLVAGGLAALQLAGGPTAFQLAGGRAAADGAAEPPTQRRELPLFEDGDTRLRVWVPDPMRARGQRVFFELRNKLGQLVRSETVVVTVQDPTGRATGLIARPRQSEPDRFGFRFDYKTAGTYHVRIFPPETASSFDVPINVAP
jgi:hypothetical protein